MTRMVTEAVLNLIGLDSENVTLLAEQKIIPCTTDEFIGVTIQDENMRNYHTLEWDENDRPASWYFGDMKMTVISYDPVDGWVTESSAGTNLGRRDKFTINGAMYWTEIFHGDEVVPIFSVEFNEHGVPVKVTQRHVSVEALPEHTDEEPRLKLIKGHDSTEINKVDPTGKLILERTDVDGNVLETFSYDEHNRIKHITNGINNTEFDYNEHGHVVCVTSYIEGDGVAKLKLDNSDEDQREISNVDIEYSQTVPGRIETVSVGRQIIMSFTKYWMEKEKNKKSVLEL